MYPITWERWTVPKRRGNLTILTPTLEGCKPMTLKPTLEGALEGALEEPTLEGLV